MRQALGLLGWPRAGVSVVLCDDALIRRLNRDYREIDRATDVLSFSFADPADLLEAGRPVFLGEIYLSLETARRQASAARRTPDREVAHLVLHGLLHLLGHDHHAAGERRRMTAAERKLLRALGPVVKTLGVEGPPRGVRRGRAVRGSARMAKC